MAEQITRVEGDTAALAGQITRVEGDTAALADQTTGVEGGTAASMEQMKKGTGRRVVVPSIQRAEDDQSVFAEQPP